MKAMQTAGVLNEPSFERKRHRKDEGVELRQVEPFADQGGSREKNKGLIANVVSVGSGPDFVPRLLPNIAFEVIAWKFARPRTSRQCRLKSVQIALSVRQHERAPPFIETKTDGGHDSLDPCIVRDDRIPNLVNRQSPRAGRQQDR